MSYGGEYAQQNNWRGGENQGWRNQQQGSTQLGPCKCCGKKGHQKAACHHKNKECEICGKEGHLKAVCRQGTDADAPQRQPPKAGAAPGAAAATKIPWLCLECGATNPDKHIKKCQNCKTVGKKQDDVEEKSALSPTTVQLMQQTAPEKLEEEAAKDEEELKDLEAAVKNSAKSSDRSNFSRVMEENQKKRIAELREKMRKTQSPDNKVVKSIMGDKSREENNYDGKRKQLEGELQKAIEKKEAVMEKIKEDIKEAAKVYEEKKKHLEQGLKDAEGHWDKQINDLREKKAKEEETHRKATQEYAAATAARAAPEVAASIAAATAAEAGAAAQKALGEANLEITHVEEPLRTDVTLQGLPQMNAEQTKAMATSVQGLVDQQLRALVKSWEQKFIPLDSEEEEEDDGDDRGFQKKLTRGQKKVARKRRADPSIMIDDSTERKSAEKRPADEETTKIAEEEKEDAAGASKTAAKVRTTA